uniref:Uncharacterized protein n=1 Tax=Arundo donax TaxID=35708 RepID=A0A0A9HM80_ARUDO
MYPAALDLSRAWRQAWPPPPMASRSPPSLDPAASRSPTPLPPVHGLEHGGMQPAVEAQLLQSCVLLLQICHHGNHLIQCCVLNSY